MTLNLKDRATRLRLAAALLRAGKGRMKQFAEFIFTDNKGNGIVFAQHHDYLNNWLDECDKAGYTRRVIGMPFESGKTQNVVIFRTSRDIGRDHNIRVKVGASNSQLAEARVVALKNTIQHNDKFKMVYPDCQPDFNDWGKTSITVKRSATSSTDSTVQAAGIMSSIMGGRVDRLKLDDPVDYINSISSVKRESIKAAIKGNWMSRCSHDCIVDWIGTPWHPQDAMNTLTIGGEWQRLWMPIKEDLSCFEVFVNGKKVDELPMWVLLSAEIIEAKRKDPAYGIGMVKSGIHLQHFVLENRIFDNVENHIVFNCDPRSFDYSLICGGIDYSSAKRPGTFLGLVGLRKDGKKIPIDPRYLHKPDQLAANIADQASLFLVDHYNAESNALQSVITDMNRKYRPGVAINDFTTGANKKDPRTGLPRISDEISEGMWQFCIPHPAPFCGCDYCKLANDFLLASWDDDTTPDGCMGVWFADEGIRKRKLRPSGVVVVR